MKALRFTSTGITLSALLAGCGGTQDALSVAPSSVTPTVARISHGKSWMLPEASNEDLLYIVPGGPGSEGTVGVYDYTTGTLVGTLTGFSQVNDVCSDSAGDIYVVNQVYYHGSTIVEYAHGGSAPTRVIAFPDSYGPTTCSINPKTGDLAVGAYYENISKPAAVFVYRKAKGTPKSYNSTEKLSTPSSVTYTGNSDIVLLGITNYYTSSGYFHVRFALLPHDAKAFHKLKASNQTSLRYHALAWDGTYLAVLGRGLSRFKVNKRNLKKVGDVLTTTNNSGFAFCLVPKYGQVVIAENSNTARTYDYPSGNYVRTFSVYEPVRIAFSGAPSRTRIR